MKRTITCRDCGVALDIRTFNHGDSCPARPRPRETEDERKERERKYPNLKRMRA